MRQNMEELQATQEEMERKRVEQEQLQNELHQELTLLNALMNNIPDYIYFKDEKSRFIRISKSMVNLFNANSPEELVGKSDFDFHTKENAEKFYKEELDIMQSRDAIIDRIDRETFDDGKDQWVSVTKMPLFDVNGKVVGTWGISKVITDLKETEIKANEMAAEAEKLKSMVVSHEQEYYAIVKAIDSSTFVAEFSPDGNIIRVNEPLSGLLGLPSSKIEGRHHSEFFRTKDEKETDYKTLWNDLRKGIVRQKIFKGTIGNNPIELKETYSPVSDAAGNVIKIIAISVKV